MSLDGLRAWIGEVERKLGMRTRVFLVLVAIAIGGAGAGIYLALDADDNGGGASADEVQALEERIDALSLGAASESSSLEPRVTQLETEVGELRAEQNSGGKGGGGGGGTSKEDAEDAAEEFE